MQTFIRKNIFAVLFCLSLCACSGNGSSPKIVSMEEEIQDEQVYFLNNQATVFGEYLLVNSMHTKLVFYNRDDAGSYDSWMFPEELLPEVSWAYRHFKYKDQLVCVSQIEKGNSLGSEIIIYGSDFVVKSRKVFASFSPQYICGALLYGYSNSTEYLKIIAIDLETLEAKEICKLESEKRPGFIIRNNKEMIVREDLRKGKTAFSKWENGKLVPLFEAKTSVFVDYDDRGVFYLEEDTDSYWNLMLWDGEDIQKIKKIGIDDMDNWIFFNGFPGNIIIEEEFFISIHTFTEEPYLSVQDFDSKNERRIPLRKWNFTEADMARFGETFSGVYYENGQIVYYFFSNKAGLLQTQTIDIKGTRK